MPEGDTLRRTARALRPTLEERVLTGVQLRGGRPVPFLTGRQVSAVRARGKHLLIELDDGHTLHSHLGMKGSWHRYAPGEPWRLPRSAAHLVLETADDVAVCFRAGAVNVLAPGEARRFPPLATLGPDLMDDPPDLARALANATQPERRDWPLTDLLLDQRVAAGVGNIFKCEVLFLEGLHPLTPTGDLDEPALQNLFATASAQLRANDRPGPRRTRLARSSGGGLGGDSPHWVYRRVGRPCFRCATRVQSARLGRDARTTYWCPRCQPK